jgi:hypothetical protein
MKNYCKKRPSLTFALFILTSVILSSPSRAGSIITDRSKLQKISTQLLNHPSYIKSGLLRKEVHVLSLGKKITPYYLDDGSTKAIYRNSNHCYELTVLKSKNLAKQIECNRVKEDLHLEEFDSFTSTHLSPLPLGFESFETSTVHRSFDLRAFLHSYDLLELDRAILGEDVVANAPKTNFNTELFDTHRVHLQKDRIMIEQDLQLHISQIGIMAPKIKKMSHRFELKDDGVILSNGQGQVILYNPPRPHPLGDYELKANLELIEFLESLSVESKWAPVCFRDSPIGSSTNDCHKKLLKPHPLGLLHPVRGVWIDFVRKEIKFLPEI